MKICGIVAEYNPFHKGHEYQIAETRKRTGCDLVIAVMSGNFVQRGEPAIIDKFSRAEAAVKNGVDLVIELPYIFSTQSANNFAHGAVTLLKLAGADYISFGSECGNLENLQDIAETPINPDHLHQSMNTGLSFPKAYGLLTTNMMPNDILAVSYLKEIQNSDIKPIIIQRTSNYQDTCLSEVSSALAIRTALLEKKRVTGTTVMADQLEKSFLPDMSLYYPYIRTYLLITDPETLSNCFMISEGIENHLITNAKKEDTWEGFLSSCVNYRYTASRIRRCCLQIICQISKEEKNRLPELDTLRVLAFNDAGRKYLHDMRKSEIHFANRFAEVPYPYRKMEYKASLLYASVFPSEIRREILEKEIGGAHYIK